MARGHSLTRAGEDFNRRHFYRRDTKCLAILMYRETPRARKLIRTEVRVVNLSEQGILLLIDKIDVPLGETYVVLPGLKAKVPARVVRQGDFVLALEFEVLVPSRLVDAIAAMEAPALVTV